MPMPMAHELNYVPEGLNDLYRRATTPMDHPAFSCLWDVSGGSGGGYGEGHQGQLSPIPTKRRVMGMAEMKQRLKSGDYTWMDFTTLSNGDPPGFQRPEYDLGPRFDKYSFEYLCAWGRGDYFDPWGVSIPGDWSGVINSTSGGIGYGLGQGPSSGANVAAPTPAMGCGCESCASTAAGQQPAMDFGVGGGRGLNPPGLRMSAPVSEPGIPFGAGMASGTSIPRMSAFAAATMQGSGSSVSAPPPAYVPKIRFAVGPGPPPIKIEREDPPQPLRPVPMAPGNYTTRSSAPPQGSTSKSGNSPGEPTSGSQGQEQQRQPKTEPDSDILLDPEIVQEALSRRGPKYRFGCSLCGKLYLQRRSYTTHFQAIHQSIRYSCDYCGKVYVQKRSLIAHQHKANCGILAGSLKENQCGLCGEQFRTSAELKKHAGSAHPEVKGHKCTGCEKVFKLRTGLNSHRRHYCKYRQASKGTGGRKKK